MKKLILHTLALLSLMLPAVSAHAAWDLGQLMQSLAQIKSGHVRFTEKRYIAILDEPVSSSGEMFYNAPDYLEKRTTTPKPQVLQLDKDRLRIEQGQQKYNLRLADRPEAIVFADSIRGALAGNQPLLEKNFKLQLNGSAERWTLDLFPIPAPLVALVTRITISGSSNQIRTIEFQQADGDHSVMHIEPVGSPAPAK